MPSGQPLPEHERLPAAITGPASLTPLAQSIIVEEIARTGNLVAAAAAAHTTTRVVRQRTETDPEFAEALREAWNDFRDGVLVPEAHRRAVMGTRKGVYYKGERAQERDGSEATIVEYSDSLLIRLLERHDPKFRPHHVVEANAGPKASDLDDLTPEERQTLEQLLLARARRLGQAPPATAPPPPPTAT